MAKKGMINTGGINGLGVGLINTNSKEFKELQLMIKQAAGNMGEEERLENHFLSIRFQMENYLNEPLPEEIIPAGQFLKKFIDALHIRHKDFAQYIDYEESNLSALINGKRRISPVLAVKFGRIFKIAPAIWLHIQSKNDLIREAKKEKGEYSKYSLKDLLKKVG